MRTRRRATSTDLRLAVECLPRRTRVAMLDAIATNEIIVGAYSNHDGICPMLAAHRAGGRTNVIAFAKAWDRFAFRDSRSAAARRATERELLVLRAHLEASLLAEDAPESDLAAARREHLELVERGERERVVKRGEHERVVKRGEHERVVKRRERERSRTAVTEPAERHSRPGDPDRSAELARRPGWAWTRVVRRYDEYERMLARLEAERAAAQPQPEERLLTR